MQERNNWIKEVNQLNLKEHAGGTATLSREGMLVSEYAILDKFQIKETLEGIKDQVWKAGEVVKETKTAEYVLKSPEILKYVPEVSKNNCTTPAHIEIKVEKLVVSCDMESMSINDKSIDLHKKSQNEVKNWIKETLATDCASRRDYSKMDEEILAHPDVYQRYLRLNAPKQHPAQNRIYFDKMFG